MDKITITHFTLLDNDLSWVEKAVIEKIHLLDNDFEKGCWASASYLATFIGIKETSMRNLLSALTKRKKIQRVFYNGHQSGYRSNVHPFKVFELSLKCDEPSQINDEPSQISDTDRHKFMTDEPSLKCDTTIRDKDENKELIKKEKKISYEITKKNSKPLFEIFPIPRPDVELELWTEFLEMRASMKKPLTKRGFENIIRDLKRLDGFDLNRRITDALDRKWQGLIFKDDFEKGDKTNGKQYSNRKKGNGEIVAEYAEFFASESFQNLGNNQQDSDYTGLEYDFTNGYCTDNISLD